MSQLSILAERLEGRPREHLLMYFMWTGKNNIPLKENV